MSRAKNVTFYKVMTGYEFIEFMRKFGWKHNGKYHKPHKDVSFSAAGYYRLSETRRNFEGWDYWFGRCFPTDVLDEETEITYSCDKMHNGNFEAIKAVLLHNGFQIRENAE